MEKLCDYKEPYGRNASSRRVDCALWSALCAFGSQKGKHLKGLERVQI